MKKILFLAILSLASASAFAGTGTWSSVTIKQVAGIAGSTGYVELYFSAGSTGGPSCGSTNNLYATIDVTTAPGMATYGIAMKAMSMGDTVTIYGTGACTSNSSFENVSTLWDLTAQ